MDSTEYRRTVATVDRAITTIFGECKVFKEYRPVHDAIEYTIYTAPPTKVRVDFCVFVGMPSNQIWHIVHHAKYTKLVDY